MRGRPPDKDEIERGSGSRPISARFILADGTELGPPSQEKKPEPTNGVERDGQVYEEADEP